MNFIRSIGFIAFIFLVGLVITIRADVDWMKIVSGSTFKGTDSCGAQVMAIELAESIPAIETSSLSTVSAVGNQQSGVAVTVLFDSHGFGLDYLAIADDGRKASLISAAPPAPAGGGVNVNSGSPSGLQQADGSFRLFWSAVTWDNETQHSNIGYADVYPTKGVSLLSKSSLIGAWVNPEPNQPVYNASGIYQGTFSDIFPDKNAACGGPDWENSIPTVTFSPWAKETEPDLQRVVMVTLVCGSLFQYGRTLEVRSLPDQAVIWSYVLTPVVSNIFLPLANAYVWVDPATGDVVAGAFVENIVAWRALRNISLEEAAAKGCPAEGEAFVIQLVDGVLESFICSDDSFTPRGLDAIYDDTEVTVVLVGVGSGNLAFTQNFTYTRHSPFDGFVRGAAENFGIDLEKGDTRLQSVISNTGGQEPLSSAGAVGWSMSTGTSSALFALNPSDQNARRTVVLDVFPGRSGFASDITTYGSNALSNGLLSLVTTVRSYADPYDTKTGLFLLHWTMACGGGQGDGSGDDDDGLENLGSPLWTILFIALPIGGAVLGVLCCLAVFSVILFTLTTRRARYSREVLAENDPFLPKRTFE